MRSEFFIALSWRVIAIASAIATGFFSLRLIGRHLAPAEFGVVLVALQLMSYLPLLDGGFRTATNRRLLAETERKGDLIGFSQTFYSYFGFLALGVALLIMLGYAWAGVGGLTVTLRFYLALGVTGALLVISSAQIGLLLGLKAQHAVYALSTAGYWLNFLFLWFGLRQGWSVWAFPIGSLANFAGTFPASLILIRRKQPEIKFFQFRLDARFWATFKNLRREAWECFRSQVATLFLFTFDVVLVGFLCGPSASAIYGVVTRIFTMLRGFLQSSGEVAWPIVAQLGVERAGFQRHLERINAWIYGGVTGAAALSLIPILRWFMGSNWVPSPGLVAIVATRFVIAGLATPATYFLYGLGDFRILSRYLERELFASIALSFPGAFFFGVEGLAAGFLLGTLLGTCYPILRAYSGKVGRSAGSVLLSVWGRAIIGLLSSVVAAGLIRKQFPRGPATLLVAAGGLASAMLVAGGCITVRLRMDKLKKVRKKSLPVPENGLMPGPISKKENR